MTPSTQPNFAVILTGSTGSIGSYLLESLVKQNHVTKIFCLNRGSDSRTRQTQNSGSRGLSTGWDEERVKFIESDLALPKLGLDQATWNTLRQETTHIIHNAWPVNFNWHIDSFEPHVKGVRNLLDFCLVSKKQVNFVFLSTIGTVTSLDLPAGVSSIKETASHNIYPGLGGYNGSKLVSELIIERHVKSHASQKAAVCRVGQVAGPVLGQGDAANAGAWNKQEWIPTMIASSKQLRLLPSDLGFLDQVAWVPVDILAEVVLELSDIKERFAGSLTQGEEFTAVNTNSSVAERSLPVYHAVNPHSITWSSLLPTIAERLNIEPSSIVPWKEWIDALRVSSEKGFTVDTIPGLKLIAYFDDLLSLSKNSTKVVATLDTKLSVARSKTLASLDEISADWMNKWLDQWAL